MQVRLLLLLFGLNFLCTTLPAQNHTIDSLHEEVKAWFPVKDRTELLLDLAYEYIKVEQPEITDSICMEVIRRNEGPDGYNQTASAYLVMAQGVIKNNIEAEVVERVDSLLTLSKKYFQLSKDSIGFVKSSLSHIYSVQEDLMSPQTRDMFLHLLNYESALRGKAANQRAFIYYDLYKFYNYNSTQMDSAAWYWSKYIEIIDENIDQIDVVEVILDAAKHYHKSGDFYKTLAYIDRAKKEAINGNWLTSEIIIAEFESDVFVSVSWHDKSIEILQEGVQKMENREIHPYFKVRIHQKLGNSYQNKEDYEKSLYHYNVGRDLALEFDSAWAERIYPYVVNAKVGAYQKEEDIQHLIALNPKLSDKPSLYHSNLYRLTDIFTKKKQWDKAEKYLNQTWGYYVNSEQTAQMDALYNLRAKIYQAKNRFNLAYQDQLTAHQLQDSVNEAFAQKAILMMEHDLLQKEELIEKNKQIEILKIEKSKRESELQFYLMLLLSLLVLIGGILFWRNRRKIWSKREQEFEGKLRDMETFNQGVSHNINAPLNHALYVLKKKSPKANEKAQDYILEARKITNALAEFVQIDQTRIQESEFQLSSLVQPLFAEYQSQNPSIDFVIDESIMKSPVELTGDKYLLNLALRNLMENAITHAKPAQQPLVITVSFKREHQKNHLTISDNGRGITPTEAPSIFDLHYSSKKDNNRNKGLGLAIVKKVMDKHFGEVLVKPSTLGGAAFTLAY